jgi:hypothetical protein
VINYDCQSRPGRHARSLVDATVVANRDAGLKPIRQNDSTVCASPIRRCGQGRFFADTAGLQVPISARSESPKRGHESGHSPTMGEMAATRTRLTVVQNRRLQQHMFRQDQGGEVTA